MKDPSRELLERVHSACCRSVFPELCSAILILPITSWCGSVYTLAGRIAWCLDRETEDCYNPRPLTKSYPRVWPVALSQAGFPLMTEWCCRMSPSFLQSGLGFEYQTSAGIDSSSCSVWVEKLWSTIREVTDAMLLSVAKNLARSDGVPKLSMMVIMLVSSARAPVSSVSCASWAGESFPRADIWKGTQKHLYIYNRDHCQCCGKKLQISYVYVVRSQQCSDTARFGMWPTPLKFGLSEENSWRVAWALK